MDCGGRTWRKALQAAALLCWCRRVPSLRPVPTAETCGHSTKCRHPMSPIAAQSTIPCFCAPSKENGEWAGCKQGVNAGGTFSCPSHYPPAPPANLSTLHCVLAHRLTLLFTQSPVKLAFWPKICTIVPNIGRRAKLTNISSQLSACCPGTLVI